MGSGRWKREYISIQIVKYPFAISCDGKYYKRSGSTLQELNGFELQNFLLQRAGKTWDDVALPEVKVSDLSKEALDAFRNKAVMSNRMTESDVNVSDELLLQNLKLLDGNKLIRAAVLLFHPMPEHFATGAFCVNYCLMLLIIKIMLLVFLFRSQYMKTE